MLGNVPVGIEVSTSPTDKLGHSVVVLDVGSVTTLPNKGLGHAVVPD